jgi:hypothetical protein
MGKNIDLPLNSAYNSKIGNFTEFPFLKQVSYVYFSAINSPVSFEDKERDVWLDTMNFLYVYVFWNCDWRLYKTMSDSWNF